MSEVEDRVAGYDKDILNKIINQLDGYSLPKLVDTSRYSFMRPMFDSISEEDEKELSIREKFKKYNEKIRLQFRKKFGNLSIQYNYRDENISLPLSKIADFISNDIFLINPYLSEEYFAGVDKLIETGYIWEYNLFDKEEYYNMHEDLEYFDKDEIIGRRRIELLVRIKRIFTTYMFERKNLMEKLNQDVEKLKDTHQLEKQNLISALLYRLEHTEKILFNQTQAAEAAFL